ncbi:1-deoxy-D-xylulose-5-phosphate reductoisomerase [Candidatus Aerophobetes bacterium]|uniref:1-deoxy-D-xylulose 5-phosphate reductoisomerase n=1 Tax=Aerophobetes bacterium TaxID=2030807 RepID=A0A523TJU1_UNCAE|nr:MAG: 1-deoxy-D-xylulose-5-phosphate reductoisomerase [Candidatus Aerophobetes bacterium]
MRKRIIILGSTGSVGKQALEVIQEESQYFKVIGLTGKDNWQLLKQQAEKFSPLAVALANKKKVAKLKGLGRGIKIYGGEEGVLELIESLPADLILSCIVGKAALIPTLEALKAGRNVALANKESMVIAGRILMEEAHQRSASLIPIDSEQSAIFQCMQGHRIEEVKRIYLTASGGPFRDWQGDFDKITPEESLSHPCWDMGSRISLDSATLVNKALEVIETSHLFKIDLDRIRILIHPQSIVHSLVEFVDGSILAQLGITDMRLPIHYALNFPQRRASHLPSLELSQLDRLSFEAPDYEKFPALRLGYHAGREGGTLPAVFNAVDEEAGKAFLGGKITFPGIVKLIKRVMEEHHLIPNPSLEEILEADQWAREKTRKLVGKIDS